MSKNITIQEGGVAKPLVADKLKTNLTGGGTCNWVPEDETQLQVKYIDANGEYEASADEVYGYSKVVVRVPGGAGGEGPGGSGEAVPGGPGSSVVGTDGDGDEAEVSVDEDGEIQTQKIPSSIRVLEPPTNPYGIYRDGQTISTDGMRVDAYLKSGDRWQTVPSNQISLNPTVAIYDESTDPGISGTATLDGVTYPIIGEIQGTYSPPPGAVGSAVIGFTSGSGTASAFFTSQQSGTPLGIIASQSNPISYESITINYGPNIEPYYTRHQRTANGTAYTRNGKTVYYTSPSLSDVADYSAPVVPDYGSRDIAAWAIIYGDVEINPAGSHQTITASWPQPSTGKPLTDTFEILVAPGYTPNSGT